MLSIKRRNTSVYSATTFLKKCVFSKSLLNLAIALLPSAAMALTLPKTPCVLNLFWATGYQDLLESMDDAVSAKISSSVKMPEVDIGGQDFGSKRTFDALKEFLKKCQEQRSPTIVLFSIDKPTYWANKEQFDALAAEYPQNFRPFFLDDFIKHPAVQEYHKVLPFFNKTFRLMPVTGANLFRLLAPCFPKALKLGPQFESNSWSWIYIDIDNFIDGMEQDRNQEENSLTKMLEQPSEEASLFVAQYPEGIDNSALRIEATKSPEEFQKYKEYITSLQAPLNKEPEGFSYYDKLTAIIKGQIPENRYLDETSIANRITFSNPLTSSPSISGKELLKQLIKILPTQIIECPATKCALEWLGGIYISTTNLINDEFISQYTENKITFINSYMESLMIINDLLKFFKVKQWLLWQKKFLQQELASITNLEALINVALTRLIQINPFPTNYLLNTLTEDYITTKRKFSRQHFRQSDTAVSAILALTKKLSKAYPDHPLVVQYLKENKACQFLKQDLK